MEVSSSVNQPDSITRCLSLVGKDAGINAPPVRRVFRTGHLEPYPRYTEPPGAAPVQGVVQQSHVPGAGTVAAPLESVQRAEEER